MDVLDLLLLVLVLVTRVLVLVLALWVGLLVLVLVLFSGLNVLATSLSVADVCQRAGNALKL